MSAPVSLEPWAFFTALLCAFVCVYLHAWRFTKASFLAAQALYLLLWGDREGEREGAEAEKREKERKKERNDREKEMKDRDTRLKNNSFASDLFGTFTISLGSVIKWSNNYKVKGALLFKVFFFPLYTII